MGHREQSVVIEDPLPGVETLVGTIRDVTRKTILALESISPIELSMVRQVVINACYGLVLVAWNPSASIISGREGNPLQGGETWVEAAQARSASAANCA